MTNLNFMIAGGDCRFSYMKKIIESQGFKALRVMPGEYSTEDIINTDVFILPVPVSRDGLNINAPLCNNPKYFSDFAAEIPKKKTVAGGLFLSEHRDILLNKEISVIDYYKNADLTKKNAIPTAEGVIGILINALPQTIYGLRCAVTGYGNCGTEICRKLKCLGADVTLVARSERNIDAATHDGMKTCFFKDFPGICRYFNVIINTVPAMVLGEKVIMKLKRDCVLIEIASSPFGIDFDTASEYGITVIKAGSLPGKIAPETAARIIFDSVMDSIGR